MATIAGRIRELLASHPGDAAWREQAAKLGKATSSRTIFAQHPLLRRLMDLRAGWLDRSRAVRVADAHPRLAGADVVLLLELELADEEQLDESGPVSDFDPLNSVLMASVPMMSVWYSLVCLPGEAVTDWPVVECDPSAGDDAVRTVAVNVEHFVHQLMCRSGPHSACPLVDAPEEVAADVLRLMGTAFGISVRDARAVLAAERRARGMPARDAAGAAVPGPYVDAALLRQLDRLAVLPA